MLHNRLGRRTHLHLAILRLHSQLPGIDRICIYGKACAHQLPLNLFQMAENVMILQPI